MAVPWKASESTLDSRFSDSRFLGIDSLIIWRDSSWAVPTRDAAVESVMGSCRMEHLKCKIISCSPDVDTEAAADAHWPPTAGTTYIYCGVPGRPACN